MSDEADLLITDSYSLMKVENENCDDSKELLLDSTDKNIGSFKAHLQTESILSSKVTIAEDL